MDWLVWTVIGIAAAIVLVLVVLFAIKFFKMNPEERKELVIQFLIGLVTIAESTYNDEAGQGKEKVAWVEEQFNKTAPWFLKIVLLLTKTADLNDLIDKALKKAKETEWDKFKTNK